MVIEKKSGHVAYQFEEDEEFFELGYKVLAKQHIKDVLPCIRVQYNLRDRLLYDVEQYTPLVELFATLSPVEALDILKALLDVIVETGSNGFVPIEAVQAEPGLIYVEPKEHLARFIVLPISKEYETGDHRSWNKRLWDTIHELLAFLPDDWSNLVIKCLSQQGKLIDNIAESMPVLESFEKKLQTQETLKTDDSQPELQLMHDGVYGRFALYIKKKEFIIGKKRDSVDGYLGMSDVVSRLHCKIVRHNDTFGIIDLGSSNHTFVNGILVHPQEERRLTEGDRIRIADIDFLVHIAV